MAKKNQAKRTPRKFSSQVPDNLKDQFNNDETIQKGSSVKVNTDYSYQKQIRLSNRTDFVVSSIQNLNKEFKSKMEFVDFLINEGLNSDKFKKQKELFEQVYNNKFD